MEAVLEIEASEEAYYRWKKDSGLMDKNQLRKENRQLKKVVADLALDKYFLKEALNGKY